MSRARGILTLLLLLLSCASSAAYALKEPQLVTPVSEAPKANASTTSASPRPYPLPAPEDLCISIPVFGNVTVTWKHVEAPENNSMYYWVQIKTTDFVYKKFVKTNTTYCLLTSLHRGGNVRVAAVLYTELDGIVEDVCNWTSKDLPPSRGEEGTAARGLQCNIFMTAHLECLHCDWLPGQKAPSDTQYHLYYRSMKFRWMETAEECPHYVTEPGGQRHSGCRVPLQDRPNTIWILVNGSSASREIEVTDRKFLSAAIAVLPPVQNFSLTREGFRWEKPVLDLSPLCFAYEVHFWSKDENRTITIDSTSYWNEDLKEPASKTHVRVRGIGKDPCWDNFRPLGPWSEVITIERKEDDLLWITLSISFFVACLALFVLGIRYWRSLFPQIPKPKDDLKEAFKHTQNQALMRCNSWDTEEVISYLEVMTPPNKPHKLPLDYTNVTD